MIAGVLDTRLQKPLAHAAATRPLMDENAFASLSLDGTMEAAEVCDDVPPLPSPMRRKPNKRMDGTVQDGVRFEFLSTDAYRHR